MSLANGLATAIEMVENIQQIKYKLKPNLYWENVRGISYPAYEDETEEKKFEALWCIYQEKYKIIGDTLCLYTLEIYPDSEKSTMTVDIFYTPNDGTEAITDMHEELREKENVVSYERSARKKCEEIYDSELTDRIDIEDESVQLVYSV